MYAIDGTPAAADPRHVLARAIERLQARSLYPVLAVELEFYVLRDGQPAGSIALARAVSRPTDLRGSRSWPPYSTRFTPQRACRAFPPKL
jgi:glutamine synthetase